MRRRSVIPVVYLVGLLGCEGLVGIRELEVGDGTFPLEAGAPEDLVDGGADTATDSEPLVDASVDTDADAGAEVFKRVFVTKETTSGAIGGLKGADERCNNAAESTRLGGTWVAYLSGDGMRAIDRLTFDGPYRLLDGREVVSKKEDLLSGKLKVPINVVETGETAAGNVRVWTGSRTNGNGGATCNNWSTNNLFILGTIGSLDRTLDGRWMDNGGPPGLSDWGCQTDARLYCFEL